MFVNCFNNSNSNSTDATFAPASSYAFNNAVMDTAINAVSIIIIRIINVLLNIIKITDTKSKSQFLIKSI